MPAPFPNGVTVVRQRATRVSDPYGVDRLDWTDPDLLSIDGCGIAPTVIPSPELGGGGRDGVISGWTLYAPHGSDIDYQDRVIIPGVGAVEVFGEPAHWENPYTGSQPGTSVTLRRIEG